MKYNSLIDKNEDDILDKLKQHYKKANFEVTPNGYVNQLSELCDICITRKLADEINLFDDNGICRIKFNHVAGGFKIRNVKTMKSCINLPVKTNPAPHVVFDNIDLYALDYTPDSVYHLVIKNCKNINDLSQVTNIRKTLRIENCQNIKKFSQLPDLNDAYPLVYLTSLRFTPDKNGNNSVRQVFFDNTNGFTDLQNLPKELESLSITSNDMLMSLHGIDTYDNLQHFHLSQQASNLRSIILILLCKKLDDIFFYHSQMIEIIKKYMKMPISTRSDHVMDCAVELIDAGYPDAAEL